MHDPEGSVSVDDQDLQISKSHTNQCKREGLRVDQDSFRARAAFSALVYVLFCCQVLRARVGALGRHVDQGELVLALRLVSL